MIKYECELCGKLINQADAIGADVGPDGTRFVWQDRGQALIIEFRADRSVHQYCKGCMFANIREMMRQMFPDDRTAQLEEFYQASMAVDRGTINFDLHNDAVARLEAAERALRPELTTNYFQHIPEEGLVFDDPAPASDPGEHQDLSELYAGGKLPEPGTGKSAERRIISSATKRRVRDNPQA